MPGKRSSARYRAMLEDVKRRAWYAFSSGDHTNPYAEDDKRHPRFIKALHHIRIVDDDFEDMCAVQGCDTSTWQKRVHPWPGPVVPLGQLA